MTFAYRGADCVNVFAHARRQRILRLLAAHPEIGQSLKAMQRATGYRAGPLLRHLQIMERAGLITRDPAGQTVTSSLVPGLRLRATAPAPQDRRVA